MKGDQYRHRDTGKHPGRGNTSESWDASRANESNQGIAPGTDHRRSAIYQHAGEEGGMSFMWRDSVDDSASHGTSPVESTWSPYRPIAPYRETTRSSRDLTSRAQQYYQTGKFGPTEGESSHQDVPPSSSETYEPETGTFFDARSSIGGEEQQSGDHSAALTGNVHDEGTGKSSLSSSDTRETIWNKLFEALSYQGQDMARIIYALDKRGIDRSTVLPAITSDVNVTASLDMEQRWYAQEELPSLLVRTSYTLNQGDIDLINQMYPNRQSQVISKSESRERASVTSTYEKLANWSFGDQPIGGNTEVHYEGDAYISSINNTLTSQDAKQLANILEYLHRSGEDASTLLMGYTLPDEQGNVTVTLCSEGAEERTRFQEHFSEPFQNSYTMSMSEQNQLENSILGRPSALAKMNVGEGDWQEGW